MLDDVPPVDPNGTSSAWTSAWRICSTRLGRANSIRVPTWSACASSVRRCGKSCNRRPTKLAYAHRRKRIRKKLHRRARQRRGTSAETPITSSPSASLSRLKALSGVSPLKTYQGICRDSIRFRKPQRARMAGWAHFDQLRQFIAYKAQAAGVRVKVVDPKHTSQMCSQCEHVERANRLSQSRFCCRLVWA